MTSSKKIGYLLAAAAVCMWAVSSGTLVKLTRVDGLTFAAWGGLFGFAYGWSALAAQGKLHALRVDRRRGKLLLGIAAAHAVNAGLFFSALKIGSVGNATLSHYIAPILVTCLFAPLLLQEPVNRLTLYLTLTSFLGLLLLFIPSLSTHLDLGLLLGAGSGVAMALHVALERKISLLAVNPLTVSAYKSSFVTLAFGYFALRSLPTTSWFDFAIMACWGVAILGISLQLFQKALAYIPATHAALITYLEPLGALLIAALVWKESITIYTVIGGLMILGSGLLLITRAQQTEHITSQPFAKVLSEP
ncbi:MAG: DMT family transporter [Caldilineaceae bacterium]